MTGTGGAVGGAGGGAGGSTGSGGSGAGGSTAAPTTCAADTECAPAGLFCELTQKRCVQCLTTAHCPADSHCFGNVCSSAGTACNAGTDCSTGQVCDPARGLCVQCVAATDCSTGQECVDNKCAVSAACSDSLDCASGKVCNTNTKRCVECVTDADCTPVGTTNPSSKCVQGACRPLCTSDKQCTPDGMLCDSNAQVCVQCKNNGDCPASSNCDQGMCKADICDSTQGMCSSNNGVVHCNSAGNGWSGMTACPAEKPCKAYGGAAGCGGPAVGIDGGVGPVDGGDSDGPAPGCTAAVADPCTAGIPKSAVTPVVDGLSDDICSAPSFQLAAATAAKVNNYNNVPPTQFETATVRVAWTPAGLHVFVDVLDASVQTVNMVDPGQGTSKAYQGDSIEVFITSSNNVTGLTEKDANSLHVILPAGGPAVSVKTGNGSSGAPTALPASQFKQATTATGYAVEALLPWPGGNPTTGTTVRFDLGLNSADKTFGGVDDMRDGQLLYYVGTVSGGTTCQSGDGTVPFCDNRTWCQAALQ